MMAAGVASDWNLGSNKSLERLHTNTLSSENGGSSNGSTATIAANDFLTLLVTEMKNQDPTATTDPNEYVNQLVQVNSLQQLISINETLQKAVSPTPISSQSPQSDQSGVSHVRTTAASDAVSAAGETSVSGASKAALQIATALTR